MEVAGPLLALHQARHAAEPSAAEILEATKRLYIKTDILKDLRVEPGSPRIFHFPLNEAESLKNSNRPRAIVLPMKPPYRLQPSAQSAFRVVKASQGKPRSCCVHSSKSTLEAEPQQKVEERLRTPIRSNSWRRHKVKRLAGDSCIPSSSFNTGIPPSLQSASPPPLPPPRLQSMQSKTKSDNCQIVKRRKSLQCFFSQEGSPVPLPRISKMCGASNARSSAPKPLPRRRTLQVDHLFSQDFIMTKSTPDLSFPAALSIPSSCSRKRCQTTVRPATPIPTEYELEPFPSCGTQLFLDSKENYFSVCGASHPAPCIKLFYDVPSPSWPTLERKRQPSAVSLSSPTSKDSGLQQSSQGGEDMRSPFSGEEEKNNCGTCESGEDAESVFTSITNQPKNEDWEGPAAPAVPLPPGKGQLSVIDRNRRVMEWIFECRESAHVFGESLNV